MPRRSKGPRLWLQPTRKRDDGSSEPAVWCIRDRGGYKRSTGFSAGQTVEAEGALKDYIAEKHAAPRYGARDPSQILVAHVISIYTDDIAHKHARPKETAARLERVLAFFGKLTLAQITKQKCRDYAAQRKSEAAARRELEDLRAAIRHHWEEGLCAVLTPIVLPERGVARERWLTRSEAARLLWAAWRLKSPSGERIGKHLARFILVALYTGTRHSAICGAAILPTEGRGFVDLDAGVFYRRAAGERETKKRKPPIRLMPRLLAHLRRWKRLKFSKRFVVEWRDRPVLRVNKSFRSARTAAGLGPDVVPHIFRHTLGTWLAQRRVSLWEASGYLGMTVETFQQVYGHHHPDFQSEVVNAFVGRPPTRNPTISRQEPGIKGGTEAPNAA